MFLQQNLKLNIIIFRKCTEAKGAKNLYPSYKIILEAKKANNSNMDFIDDLTKEDNFLNKFKQDTKDEIIPKPTKDEIISKSSKDDFIEKSTKDDFSNSTKEEVICDDPFNVVECKIETDNVD